MRPAKSKSGVKEQRKVGDRARGDHSGRDAAFRVDRRVGADTEDIGLPVKDPEGADDTGGCGGCSRRRASASAAAARSSPPSPVRPRGAMRSPRRTGFAPPAQRTRVPMGAKQNARRVDGSRQADDPVADRKPGGQRVPPSVLANPGCPASGRFPFPDHLVRDGPLAAGRPVGRRQIRQVRDRAAHIDFQRLRFSPIAKRNNIARKAPMSRSHRRRGARRGDEVFLCCESSSLYTPGAQPYGVGGEVSRERVMFGFMNRPFNYTPGCKPFGY
jgi:hypothetical protein